VAKPKLASISNHRPSSSAAMVMASVIELLSFVAHHPHANDLQNL
jgi:hypothetical protein